MIDTAITYQNCVVFHVEILSSTHYSQSAQWMNLLLMVADSPHSAVEYQTSAMQPQSS